MILIIVPSQNEERGKTDRRIIFKTQIQVREDISPNLEWLYTAL